MIIVYAMCMFLNDYVLFEWIQVSKLRHTFIVIRHDNSIFISFDFELTFVRECTTIDVNFMKSFTIIVNLPNEKNKISENIQRMKRYEIMKLSSKFIVSKFSILKWCILFFYFLNMITVYLNSLKLIRSKIECLFFDF